MACKCCQTFLERFETVNSKGHLKTSCDSPIPGLGAAGLCSDTYLQELQAKRNFSKITQQVVTLSVNTEGKVWDCGFAAQKQ